MAKYKLSALTPIFSSAMYKEESKDERDIIYFEIEDVRFVREGHIQILRTAGIIEGYDYKFSLTKEGAVSVNLEPTDKKFNGKSINDLLFECEELYCSESIYELYTHPESFDLTSQLPKDVNIVSLFNDPIVNPHQVVDNLGQPYFIKSGDYYFLMNGKDKWIAGFKIYASSLSVAEIYLQKCMNHLKGTSRTVSSSINCTHLESYENVANFWAQKFADDGVDIARARLVLNNVTNVESVKTFKYISSSIFKTYHENSKGSGAHMQSEDIEVKVYVHDDTLALLEGDTPIELANRINTGSNYIQLGKFHFMYNYVHLNSESWSVCIESDAQLTEDMLIEIFDHLMGYNQNRNFKLFQLDDSQLFSFWEHVKDNVDSLDVNARLDMKFNRSGNKQQHINELVLDKCLLFPREGTTEGKIPLFVPDQPIGRTRKPTAFEERTSSFEERFRNKHSGFNRRLTEQMMSHDRSAFFKDSHGVSSEDVVRDGLLSDIEKLKHAITMNDSAAVRHLKERISGDINYLFPRVRSV